MLSQAGLLTQLRGLPLSTWDILWPWLVPKPLAVWRRPICCLCPCCALLCIAPAVAPGRVPVPRWALWWSWLHCLECQLRCLAAANAATCLQDAVARSAKFLVMYKRPGQRVMINSKGEHDLFKFTGRVCTHFIFTMHRV